MELAAGGVDRSLLFLRAVLYGRSSEGMDRLPEEPFRSLLSARGIVMQVADDLAAQRPEVVYVLADGLR